MITNNFNNFNLNFKTKEINVMIIRRMKRPRVIMASITNNPGKFNIRNGIITILLIFLWF